MTVIYVAAGVAAGTVLFGVAAGGTVWALLEAERIIQRRNRARVGQVTR